MKCKCGREYNECNGRCADVHGMPLNESTDFPGQPRGRGDTMTTAPYDPTLPLIGDSSDKSISLAASTRIQGWTVDEWIAFLERKPDATLPGGVGGALVTRMEANEQAGLAVAILAKIGRERGWFLNCAGDGRWGVVVHRPFLRGPGVSYECVGAGDTALSAVQDALAQ